MLIVDLFKKYYPKLEFEPEFITNSHLSSEAYNLKKLVIGNKTEQRFIRMLPSADSVKKYVLNNHRAIGIGYLSQIAGERVASAAVDKT